MSYSDAELKQLKMLHSFLASSFKGSSVGNLSIDKANETLSIFLKDIVSFKAKVEQLESENKALNEDIKKAFWWSAENTLTIHANKIQAAWEDWNTYFRGK